MKMNPNIIFSVLYLLGCVFLWREIFRFKKSDDRLNGVVWGIISVIVLLCYGTLIFGVLNIIRIPINIVTADIVYILTAAALIFYRKKTGKSQKYSFYAFDCFYLVLFVGLVAVMFIHYYTPAIQMRCYNSDSSVHFRNAMEVFYYNRLHNVYFAPLQSALTMEFFAPVLKITKLYKAFILAEGTFFALEAVFFVVFVREMVNSRAEKIAAIILAGAYMIGYPLNGWLYNFFYWGIGAMLVGYVVFFARRYRKKDIDTRFTVICLLMGCAAIPVTYMLFGPITYIALFICLFFMFRPSKKLFSKENIFLQLIVFALPCVLAVYYCYFDYLMVLGASASDIIGIAGGIYTTLYIDFLWVLPLVLFWILSRIKEKSFDELDIFFLSFLLCQLVLLVGVFKGMVSVYYFNKFFYPLWFLMFAIAVKAVVQLINKEKMFVVSLGLVWLFVMVMGFGGIEKKMVDSGTSIINGEVARGLMPLYNFNGAIYLASDLRYPPAYSEISDYVIDNLKDEEMVPLITSADNYVYCHWYEGYTGYFCEDYYTWSYSLDEIKLHLQQAQVNYFVVYKYTEFYDGNQDFINSYETVFENDYGKVLKIN